MTILKLVLFILWTLFVLAIMGYILRKLYRALKVFHGHTSADMAERILDTAEQIGVDTAGVRKLLEVTIGKRSTISASLKPARMEDRISSIPPRSTVSRANSRSC